MSERYSVITVKNCTKQQMQLVCRMMEKEKHITDITMYHAICSVQCFSTNNISPSWEGTFLEFYPLYFRYRTLDISKV